MVGDYDDDDDYIGAIRSDGDNDDSHMPKDRDNDSDSSSTGYYDSDDRVVRDFGHAASPADRRQIAVLVESYYATVLASDGAKACSLIHSPLAKGLPQVLGEYGPRYLHGLKTCSAILLRMFDRNRWQLTADAARLEVMDVRVAGNVGLAVLGFRALPVRQIEVIREHKAWKMYAPLDNELP